MRWNFAQYLFIFRVQRRRFQWQGLGSDLFLAFLLLVKRYPNPYGRWPTVYLSVTVKCWQIFRRRITKVVSQKIPALQHLHTRVMWMSKEVFLMFQVFVVIITESLHLFSSMLLSVHTNKHLLLFPCYTCYQMLLSLHISHS